MEMDKQSIGEKIDPILQELEKTILEYEAFVGHKPNYPDTSLRAATKIFMSVIMDKIFELQEDEVMDFEDRCEMTTAAGNKIRELIKVFTNLDSHDFYK